jgi:hypothetical protein
MALDMAGSFLEVLPFNCREGEADIPPGLVSIILERARRWEGDKTGDVFPRDELEMIEIPTVANLIRSMCVYGV